MNIILNDGNSIDCDSIRFHNGGLMTLYNKGTYIKNISVKNIFSITGIIKETELPIIQETQLPIPESVQQEIRNDKTELTRICYLCKSEKKLNEFVENRSLCLDCINRLREN